LVTDNSGVLSFVLNNAVWLGLDYQTYKNYLIHINYNGILVDNKRINDFISAQGLYGSVIDAGELNHQNLTDMRDINDQFTASAGQTSFTLTHKPSSSSLVQMFINGSRTNKNAYSFSGSTVTYVPANNAGYTLRSTDIIQFDYHGGLAIGDNYGGGIVAYILQPGDPCYVDGIQHGIIVLATDLTAPWGCNGATLPGANATALGTGKKNTNDIVDLCAQVDAAGKLCDSYSITFDGIVYDDWYLPSIDELVKVFTLKTLGFGNFLDQYYWSSTQAGQYHAQVVYFANGNVGLSDDKNTPLYYRPVRNF
jgi:hypothetical protein